jgi:hypothetical protein
MTQQKIKAYKNEQRAEVGIVFHLQYLVSEIISTSLLLKSEVRK